MSLLNPSPGEMLDRLSILELKIPAFKRRGWCADALEAEKAGLEERMREWEQGLIEDMTWEENLPLINESRNGLAAINALLWEAEDDVRNTEATELTKLARLAKYIPNMNDARAKQVKRIDSLYGLEAQHEKIYLTKNVVTDVDLAT